MRTPLLVGECVAAMKAAVAIPVTVKCRLGVDEQDTELALDAVADAVIAADADGLWVPARKAWLSGLSPKENREVPPLDYDRVHRLKARLPAVFVGINGGIRSLEEAEDELSFVDGVMLGRAAYESPGILANVDRRYFGSSGEAPDPLAVAEGMIPYIEGVVARGGRLGHVTRHMLGLFNGRPGARRWRRVLSQGAAASNDATEVFREALASIGEEDRRTHVSSADAAEVVPAWRQDQGVSTSRSPLIA
jgi:tRNA-dihydrouridine synthase A